MKYVKRSLVCLIAVCFMAMAVSLVHAQERFGYPDPKTYIPSLQAFEKEKKTYDDPTPWLTTFLKRILPKNFYDQLTFDVDTMKNTWEQVVGLKAPDLVGKIAPEIKPGKYTYKDLEKYPGLKELIIPSMLERIKPAGKPYPGNFPEFEIIPTRQYYWSIPVSEATTKNAGKTKLDSEGYIIPTTWEGGYPFPRPSGPFKAQQIMYNLEKRSLGWGQDFYLFGGSHGVNKDLASDNDMIVRVRALGLAGRAVFKPYGFYDERARVQGEHRESQMGFLAPRDVAGLVTRSVWYLDPSKSDRIFMYIPSMRRIRKMTSTDSQDLIVGTDLIYDDQEGFIQKLSPKIYPYKYEVIAEREYLVLAPEIDGATYATSASKGFEFRNVRLERRPVYVVKLTQLDPTYVYSKRIFYIDKETFVFYYIENYDQKGRLYRTFTMNYGFTPAMGMFSWGGAMQFYKDHVDHHTTFSVFMGIPADWKRDELNIEGGMMAK